MRRGATRTTPIYPLVCPMCNAGPRRMWPLRVTYDCDTTWDERRGLSGTCYELHMASISRRRHLMTDLQEKRSQRATVLPETRANPTGDGF